MDTLLPLLIQGLVSLVFGVIGGYIGRWIQYTFTRRLEAEREQRELRDKLTEGVAEMMERSQSAALSDMEGGGSPLEPFRRLLMPMAVLLFAVVTFAVSSYAGMAAVFVVGLAVGGRIRA